MRLTLNGDGFFEYDEKKSRFLAYAFYAPSSDAFRQRLSAVRALHPQARHAVFAYLTQTGQEGLSDDGEPAGTGGAPVMNALRLAGLSDCGVIVVRYFGGILLGSGGLTRAYAKAAVGALNAAGKATVVPCSKLAVTAEYSLVDTVLYQAKKCGVELTEKNFARQAVLSFCGEDGKLSRFTASLDRSATVEVLERYEGRVPVTGREE